MLFLQQKRTALLAVLFTLLIISPSYVFANFVFEGDKLINEKTLAKMQEIGDELYQKTGITTVLVTKNHLDKKEFLEIKDKYLKELKAPYVLWIFSKTYMDKTAVGINQMFHSPDLEGKYDPNSLFSPFSGSFTKLIVIQKSKSDPIPAAFLNGYADLTDMLASSYNIKLDSSIGHESQTFMSIFRILFYLVLLYFVWIYIKNKYWKKEEGTNNAK